MKRRLTKLVLFLLLGAIINIAVAWGCAVLLDGQKATDVDRGADATDHGNLEVFLWRRFGTQRVDLFLYQREVAEAELTASQVLPQWCRERAQVVAKDFPQVLLAHGPVFQARGWPLPVLWQDFDVRPNGRVIHGSLDVGLPDFNSDSRSPRQLPLIPIWPGFAINTIFYAAILLLLCAAPGWARRRIRARRGQCPACAYPVGVSEVCTECGALVLHRLPQSAPCASR